MSRVKLRWYFDVISPYAYLCFKRLPELAETVDIEYVPVLFAGLLKAWDMKGPAELPAKRIHTYRHCVWVARQRGIPFCMPPRHPFNPLSALRLIVARGVQHADIARVFDFIWAEGHDPELEFEALAAALGETDAAARIAQPAVKSVLADTTAQAVARGLWGVPTFDVNGELFWGEDTVDWVRAFIADPALLQAPDFRRADATRAGIVRRQTPV